MNKLKTLAYRFWSKYKLRLNISPRADVKKSWFQWNISIVDEADYVIWRVGGWWWPLGFIVDWPRGGGLNWYSARLLRLKGAERYMKIRWFGLFSWKGY